MTSPASDPENILIVWDDDELAAALDPDRDDEED